MMPKSKFPKWAVVEHISAGKETQIPREGEGGDKLVTC